jgi:hypothetical protein
MLSVVTHAQINLVPNPSFEDTVECPHFANQIDKAVGWYASRGSPDYFNECDWVGGATSIPANFQGYQYAHSGIAYSGFIAYYLPAPNQREYFTCQLLSALSIGKKYIVSFYISLGDVFFRLGCNKLGMLFSTTNYTFATPAPIGNFAQFYTDSIINDTLNWVKVSGSFIADSAYSYLTIGNFFDDTNTDTIYLGQPVSYAYYYIDDISVMEDTTTAVSEISLNDGVTIYPNPVHYYLKIKDKKNLLLKVELFNSLGQVIISRTKNENEQLDLSVGSLSDGIFYLRIYYKNEKSTYHKLLKL